jgi:hypothetical protein
LKSLKQHDFQSFAEYETQFRLLALNVDWPTSALIEQFREGLDPEVDDYLNLLEDGGGLLCTSLESVISAASHFVARSRRDRPAADRQKPAHSTVAPTRPPLPEQERDRRRADNLCAYCGANDHHISSCPRRPQPSSVANNNISSVQSPTLNHENSHYSGFLVPGRIRLEEAFPVRVLVGSGAGASFISYSLAERYGVPNLPLDHPIKISTFDGVYRVCRFISLCLCIEVGEIAIATRSICYRTAPTILF